MKATMAQRRFNWFDVIITVISLLTLLLDVATDITVTVQFFVNGDKIWGSFMLAFTVVPLIVMNAFSLKWHSTDGSLTCSTVLPHVFLVAPVQRYFHVLWLGFKSCLTGHPRYTDAALREQNDASILRLFETFLESAPQLVLQLYIMLLHPNHFTWIQVVSAGSSLISLAWALMAYCDTSRLNYQTAYQRRFLALCLHCFWHLFMVSSRVAAMVLFASVCHAWICLFAGIHWLLMTIWIWVKGTDFGKGKVEQGLFRIVSGFIYVFVYLNVHDGPTRSRMTVYYCLVFLENAVLFAVWIIYGKPSLDMKVGSSVLIFGGFVLGGMCLMVYYRWLHPSGPNYLFTVKSTLSTSQYQRPKSPKGRQHSQGAEASPDSPSVLKGSTLELSIESETPSKESAKGGNSTLSHLLDSATRGALESAWQSGMCSSDSSSSSSLDADECSLDAFNTTAKSTFSNLIKKSQSVHNTSQSQTSTVTVLSRHSDACSQPEAASDRSISHRSVSSNRHTNESGQPQSPSSHSRRSGGASVRERVSESEEPDLLEGALREEADGTEAAADPPFQNGRPRSRMSNPRSPLNYTSNSSVRQHNQSILSSRADEESSSQPGLEADHHQKTAVGNQSSVLSPLDISRLWSESQRRLAPSSASDIFPTENKTRQTNRLSQSFDLGESPILSPDCAGRPPSSSRVPARLSQSFDLGESPILSPGHPGQPASNSRVKSRNSFVGREREAMAPYPDLVDSMSPEQHQQRLYVDNDYGYGERAGGESMWGVSPDTSTNSSSRAQDVAVSHPASTRQPRLVDSFDSESEPACLNTMNLQHLRSSNLSKSKTPSSLQGQVGNRPQDVLKKSSLGVSPVNRSPGMNNDENETSWTSMNVNENELSGLTNLKNLTPDDSLCSFASSDRDETVIHPAKEPNEKETTAPLRDAESVLISGASTPSIPRSRSTSSLYHEFSSAGVSPSPPPGLKGARLSRNHSWVDSPDISRQRHTETPWRQDYLNLDPAPPVERDTYFSRYDPREVIIELLMDQLKQSSLRSNHSRSESARLSPLRMSHLQGSPQRFGRSVDLFDRQAWRRLLSEDPDATLLSNPEPHVQDRQQYRNDIDLMREALDLIEMQRSPYDFRRRAPESEPGEMYVSGQYRPPIVSQGRGQVPPNDRPLHLQKQDRYHTGSGLDPLQRSASLSHQSASLPRQTGFRPEYPHPHNLPETASNSRRRSMPAGEREGLYRYFVDSDSPIHTPLWNTPRNTPATTPSHRHLLHRYLAHNHVEAGLRDTSAVSLSGEPDMLHKYSSATVDSKRLPSTLPRSTAHTGRKTAAQQLSEKLEVVTDNPDSGLHSDSVSATSRRQPLQSLDNSPSLSPSSGTQQPTHKPLSQHAAHRKTSVEQRRSSSGSRASSLALNPRQSAQAASQSLGSPKRSAVRPRPHGPAYRQAAGRSADRRSASHDSAPQGSLSSRAKSADCLR